MIITDPNGNRLGLDPAGGLISEIAGGMYWEDETFYSLDEGGSPVPAWEDSADPIKRIHIPSPVSGNYSLQVIGTGVGEFEIDLAGIGGFLLSESVFSGTVTQGQVLNFSFTGTLQTGIVEGDYNGDGVVNGHDLTVWREQYGQLEQGLAADNDRDGDVDGEDFLSWQRGFSFNGIDEASVEVPEPSSFLPIGLGVLSYVFAGRPRTPSIATEPVWRQGFSVRLTTRFFQSIRVGQLLNFRVTPNLRTSE